MKSIWEAEFSRNTIIKAGTTAYMRGVWAHRERGKGPTESTDITIVTEKDMTAREVLVLIEEKATDYVRSQGAEDIRTYFIEEVNHYKDTISFDWGV